MTVGDVFNQDDEDSSSGSKKRKLVPLDYDDDKDGKKGATAEEKRLKIKQLIESIPTAKDELFANVYLICISCSALYLYDVF